ncbi:MAG TPA: methionyl-tRNA formyltransferase, partial [Candidatus Coprocola pullicola]|nr:methionyl-tRNA formyltransferase [Candidatus Coprocola pullicola]
KNGTIQAVAQKEEEATYAPMLTKEMGHIDWSKNCQEIIHLIHGLDPAPTAYTVYKGEVIKIWQAETTQQMAGRTGEITAIVKKGFVVRTGDGSLLVTEVQAKGKKRMGADAYLRGNKMEIGTILE